jgi:tetrapyrrole methylase family protein/MazG family protein
MSKGITIVGLGPGNPGLLTMEAWQVLGEASEVYVRTRQHPTVESLPASLVIHSLDEAYENSATFAEVYAEIAARVIALGERASGVVYAVPGHPLVGEASVQRILALAEQKGLPVRIVEGLSFVEAVCARLGLDALNGLQIADATALAAAHYPEFNPDLPLLVGQLYSRDLAADVKLALMMVYPDEHTVTLVRAVTTKDESIRQMPLYELDRSDELNHLTSLYIPPLPHPGSLQAFQEVVAHLRAPEGCPWDQEQTHRSLRPFLLEETYEVLQALDSEDIPSLKEELGDLLLQVLLHTQIAVEEQEFQMADVVSHIVAKLKRRHPHVFGQVQVSGAQEVLVNWERIKKEEKNHETGKGPFSGIPDTLPALARAQAIQHRATRLGFAWPDTAKLLAMLDSMWEELGAASPENAEGLVGQMLFYLVKVADLLQVEAEDALRQAVLAFQEDGEHPRSSLK